MAIEEHIPITTNRLLLDRFREEDWRDFYQIEISQEQHRFTAEAFNPSSSASTEEYIKNLSSINYDKQETGFLLAIRRRESSGLIGFIGFQNGSLAHNAQAEVFYSIYRDFWGRGFGTEALQGMVRFGFEIIGLHRIVAYCDADNQASKRMMEKAGMNLESRFRKDRMRNGQWADGLGYAILNGDSNS